MNRSPHRISLAIATIYFGLSALWIYFSDRFVLRLSADPVVQATLQSYKGIAFVTLSALLLYSMIRIVLVRERWARQALHESEAKFRDLVETTSDWIWEIDTQYLYTYVSPAVENLLGRRPEELVGKSPFDLMPCGERERVMETFQHFVSQHLPFSDLLNINLHQDGRPVVLESSGVPIFDAEGHWRGYRGIDRDITERKRNEEALLQALTHEREIDRLKNEFIATAAHELRTPLTCVLGYAELLQQAEETGTFTREQRQEFIGHILDKGEMLNRIIDDLLDVGRLKSGHIPVPERSSCDLADLLQVAVKPFQHTAVRHRFELSLPTTAVRLNVDRARVVRALDNLLSNAVKYSPKGGTIQLLARLVDDSAVEIAIADEGIGMSAQELARVFDPFFRADVSTTALGGLGMGMAITKGIIEAHGGRIEVQSASDCGTTVSITLPLENNLQ